MVAALDNYDMGLMEHGYRAEKAIQYSLCPKFMYGGLGDNGYLDPNCYSDIA